MEDYWGGSGWTSKEGKEIEGYWEGKGFSTTPALKLFSEKLTDMKENNPEAFRNLLFNVEKFGRDILESSGISSSLTRLESALTLGYRIGMANLDFLIGKAAATNPVISNFLNFINNMAFEIEKAQQQNWFGSTLFGLIGAGLSTYYMGNPAIGYQVGYLVAGTLEAYYSTMTSLEAQIKDPTGLYQYFQLWGVFGKLIELYMAGGIEDPPWGGGSHDRDSGGPVVDPVDVIRDEVEQFKRLTRRYNLI